MLSRFSREPGPGADWTARLGRCIVTPMTGFSVKRLGAGETIPAAPVEAESPFDGVVPIPIGDCLDLHPFAPSEIGDLVDDYLDAAKAAGFLEVRFVHGRGTGSLRERVRRRVAKRSDVESIGDAPEEWARRGATVVRFRPTRGEKAD